MSLELILAIFFFGLLPLIERAIKAARERQAPPTQGPPPYPSPEDVTGSDPYDEPPYEDAPYEVPPYVPPPPVAAAPKAVRQRASEVPISRATAHDRRTADAFDRPRERRRGRGGRIADLLHTEAGLKHAFVVMTVLGPCRAFVPYDPP
jgi:hypothetical protein